MNIHPTPQGHFRIYNKIEHKRSGSYGYRVQGEHVVPRTRGRTCPDVMSVIRWVTGVNSRRLTAFIRASCIRCRARTAAFVCMAKPRRSSSRSCKIGTPVSIATTQPEDATIGPKVERVDDSKAPDPSPALMITSGGFQEPTGPLLVD